MEESSSGRSGPPGRSDPAAPVGRAVTEPKVPEGPFGVDDGYGIIAHLLSGVVLFAVPGWLLDRWLGTAFLTPVGLLVGAACSLYLVYVRLGLK